MNKREFLKMSGALVTSGILSHLAADEPQSGHRTNWSGNYQYKAERLHTPQTVEEVQQIVKRCTKAKALGARHCFNSIADSEHDQISVKNLKDMELDTKRRTVTVGAGLAYGQVAPYLQSHGYALHNLASLPHISIAGARSTATHGSGLKNGNLATVVSALEIVTADGTIRTLSREKDGEQFQGAVVDLGALGIVTKLTLDVEPTFDVRQVVYENLPFDQLEHHLEEIFVSGYSVSLFTDWQNHRVTQAWIKSRVQPGAEFKIKPEFFGAKPATERLHPLAGHSAENCTEQMGIPGPWYDRLPHFRMNFTPSSGNEVQSEYFVPLEHGYEAIRAVETLRDQVSPHLMVSEFRTIAADHLWMSPCYRQTSMALHFTWKPDMRAVTQVLPMIEEKLAPFRAKPHWGKVFTMQPEHLRTLHPKLPDYVALAKEYDPQGKFRNQFLNTNVFGS